MPRRAAVHVVPRRRAPASVSTLPYILARLLGAVSVSTVKPWCGVLQSTVGTAGGGHALATRSPAHMSHSIGRLEMRTIDISLSKSGRGAAKKPVDDHAPHNDT